ncbi:MAG TPA: dienelactone hydrolase family protein [Methylomirabilota bacterium]|nr:dienelactone hydrolase family protein [Methylomirabilota bacterium]
MTVPTDMAVTRRQMLVAGGTFAGYALGVEQVLAQAIKTDAQGLVAGDQQVAVGGVSVPAYEARPATGKDHPILVLISEIWGVHEYIKDSARRFAKAGFYAVAPELFVREGGGGHLTNIQEILKIVLSQKREQTLGDIKATVDWAKKRPNVKADRAGVTGWCWGGSTTFQVAATNSDMKSAVAWYGPPARPYQGAGGPVTGFDLAKDIKIPFLGLFGETDKNPTPEDAKKFGEMVRAHNPNVEIVVYPGAGHAFHADYRRSYNKAAADDGWNRCVAWFNKHLKA